jgi:hypothetical protein
VFCLPQPPGQTTIRSEFQTVASRFYGASIDERIAAAEEIANLGGLLPFEEVLGFARSSEAGERVAAAVALAAHLQTSELVRDDPQLQSALRALLNDGRSRVRYPRCRGLAWNAGPRLRVREGSRLEIQTRRESRRESDGQEGSRPPD